MLSARHILFSAIAALAACAEAPEEPAFRAFDLELTQPSPYANYLSVAPGARDAALPRPGQIKSRGFSRYLREKTGCVVDSSRMTATLGSRKMPAGYMVPVICP
ncbi:hypothetical protein [Roseovarius aestuarii]|uniref:Lipoprotein n=1 Tax=Roseovarius aestuarii TaxID=475083 RepID=A0A1X7BX73_9RHOB|nr:hypothetical protein [Roseovarius aestuarii]SMC14194.1 hypothetical protein ROA7745_04059 [Roseovarius aestuarii]